MKKQLYVTLIFSLAVFSILSGCKPKDKDPSPQSSISIVSVSPSTGLTETSTSFQVEVKYDLQTSDQGELGIGFNTDDQDSYHMLTSAETIVAKGSGTHTFNVTVTPKQWPGSSQFKVYVHIANSPHPVMYSPAASDTETLTFQ